MGARTSYEPGTFSWVELFTTDPDGAKRFYGELFGWQTAGASQTATQGGKAVAAISEQPAPQRSVGVPPHWLSYITVASADGSAARAAELGGAVHAGPFDVGDAGRMAVVADPTGAMLGLWEAWSSIGAELVNDPRMPDVQRARHERRRCRVDVLRRAVRLDDLAGRRRRRPAVLADPPRRRRGRP